VKIGIVFGTRRVAATAEIADWMREYFSNLGHSVVCEKPAEFGIFDCDLYVVGTAVYAFSAKRAGISRFIRTNTGRLGATPTAVFIVCGADEPPAQSTDNVVIQALKNTFLNREKYLKSVTRLLPTLPVATAFFKGYQEPEDRAKDNFESQRETVTAWCDLLLAEARRRAEHG